MHNKDVPASRQYIKQNKQHDWKSSAKILLSSLLLLIKPSCFFFSTYMARELKVIWERTRLGATEQDIDRYNDSEENNIKDLCGTDCCLMCSVHEVM